jgi:hypothetical protein
MRAAEAATTRSRQGALAARALDAAVEAQLLLLQEYGVQHARASRDERRPPWGVTFDRVRGGDDLASVRRLVGGDPRDGWVRLVFDRERGPEHYAPTVEAAHAAGLRVVGQFLDSSEMRRIGPADWRRRVERYVSGLPTVDQWEVGNEVNGSWLGPQVVEKVRFAAAHVKARTRATTLLTLHWQMGEEGPASSVFSWSSRHLSASLLRHVDDIGLSVYPEDHPLGAAFDRVMRTLHARFPHQRIGVTELGYASGDLGLTWWWGSPQDRLRGRAAVARLYQAAVLGYPYSGGGVYWWYYLQEAPAGSRLWREFADLHRQVRSPAGE